MAVAIQRIDTKKATRALAPTVPHRRFAWRLACSSARWLAWMHGAANPSTIPSTAQRTARPSCCAQRPSA
eukprot:4714119-Prymnesium_polylepis.2